MKEYKYEGETFQLDDSKGCYVEVTYKSLTGCVGVNISDTATDKNPFSWWHERNKFATPDGMTNGNSSPSFEAARDQLCTNLLRIFRTQEAAKTFDRAKYCEELHEAVKNLP